MKILALFLIMISISSFASDSLQGFVTLYKGEYYVHSNLYIQHDNEDFRIENFDNIQKFYLIGNELFTSVKDQGDFFLGTINLNLSNLKENVRTQFRTIEKLQTQYKFINKKRPKTERYLSCGITGCGIGKREIIRTEFKLELKNAEQNFCLYQNIAGKNAGVLYPEKCI